MKFKAFLWTCILVSAAFSVFAQQARTVTNADLEKYRQQRLKAEREYQENYARLGFPSPEELQKRLEKSAAEREALADRLRAERLQREQAEAAARAEAEARQNDQDLFIINDYQSYPGYVYGFPSSYYYPRRPRMFRPVGPRFGSGPAAPTRIYGAPTTPYSVPTSPFGSSPGPRPRTRFP